MRSTVGSHRMHKKKLQGKQLRLMSEGNHQSRSAAHATECLTGVTAQLPKRRGAEVRQLMLFPMRPQILHRIEFGSIGGKKLQPQAPSLLLDEVPHRAATMGRQSVPDDQQLPRNMPQQMREKLDDLPAADGARKQPEVEVPPRYPRDRRQCLPVKVILQHRCLSAWRPGA